MSEERTTSGNRALRFALGRLERIRARADERIVLLALGAIVGVCSGIAAVCLAKGLHFAGELLEAHRVRWYAPLLPAVGAIAAVVWARSLLRDAGGHGVPEIIYSVSRRRGLLRWRTGFSQLVGSMLTIASGGSAGPEAPTAVSGAVVGSRLAVWFRTNERRRVALVGAGAAGAIAAIFNAPIAGLVFALEVILGEWTALHIAPVAVASVTGTVVSRVLQGNQVPFQHQELAITGAGLIACVGLALTTALASLFFVRTVRTIEHRAAGWLARPWLRALVGGALVGGLGIAVPFVLGEGYELVRLNIGGAASAGIGWIGLVVVAKILATSLTLGTGGVGGIFAPSLVIGSSLGVLFHRAIGVVLPSVELGGEGLFALLAMAGVLSGALQAPLTAIFLITDITGGYQAIVPLLLVAITTTAFIRRFEPTSVYVRDLARRGELIRPRTDAAVLSELGLEDLLDQRCLRIAPQATLGELARALHRTWQVVVPVCEPDTDRYLGLIDVDAVRAILLEPGVRDTVLVEEVMDRDSSASQLDDGTRAAVEALQRSGRDALPVVQGDQLAGLLHKGNLFDWYRRELIVQEH